MKYLFAPKANAFLSVTEPFAARAATGRTDISGKPLIYVPFYPQIQRSGRRRVPARMMTYVTSMSPTQNFSSKIVIYIPLLSPVQIDGRDHKFEWSPLILELSIVLEPVWLNKIIQSVFKTV
mgnify:CR=1 FL=1